MRLLLVLLVLLVLSCAVSGCVGLADSTLRPQKADEPLSRQIVRTVAEVADDVGPDLAVILAGAVPGAGGVLAALGLYWRKRVAQRRLTGLVEAVQGGRAAVADIDPATLAALDEALASAGPDVRAAVEAIKAKLGLPSVTDALGVAHAPSPPPDAD